MIGTTYALAILSPYKFHVLGLLRRQQEKARTVTAVTIDLLADYSVRCARELQSAGIALPAVSELDRTRTTIIEYLKALRRRPAARPRTVHRASYVVPSDLAAGDKTFFEKVVNGDNLRPHQSTSYHKTDFDDVMLDGLGLHHFHVGTRPHPTSPLHVEREGMLLLAVVGDNDFYALGYFPHGQWHAPGILDLIHSTWPNLLTASQIRNVSSVSRSISDAEAASMLRRGINSVTQRPDGTVHFSPGGGVTTNGRSVVDMVSMTKIEATCQSIERQIRLVLENRIRENTIAAPIQVTLRQQGEETEAVADGERHIFDLQGQLYVASLL